MNIQKLSRNPRAIKALTGLAYQEFNDLVPLFEKSLNEIRMKRQNRKRNVGGGQKGALPNIETKLFFVLFYLKTYPTFDVLGFFFGKERSHSYEAIVLFSQALHKTLGKKFVLPERKINSVEEFVRFFPEVKDVFLDGTERRVQRPKNKKQQTKTYSGKKKATTRKNVIMTDDRKRVLFLSPTKSGRRHDKRLVDKISLIEHIPDTVGIWADSGFQGIQHIHPNVSIPKRGSKKKPLTIKEKEDNHIISSVRVLVEHAIGGIKRFRSVTDVFRNRRGILDDLFMELASGLWNYHLSYRY